MIRNEQQTSNALSDVAIGPGEDEGMVASDLLVNNLIYKSPASLSLCVSRTYNRVFPADQSALPTETSIWDISSGTSYVNPDNSYLTFAVKLDAGNCTFGSGSAMNLIKQIVITSRSGVELCRLERANVYSYYNSWNTLSEAFMKGQGQVEGFNSTLSGTDGNQTMMSTTPRTFCIPLPRLCGFFNPLKKGQKLPCQVMSGLHIEIEWETAKRALVRSNSTTNTTTYSLSNIAIMLDSMTLTDDVMRSLNLESARQGLEIVIPQAFLAQSTLTASTDLNVQLRKAVTQAARVVLIPLKVQDVEFANDNFLSIAADTSIEFNWRLGSLYFPKVAVKNNPECYVQTLMTYDKLRNEVEPPALTYERYITDHFSLCASLEKDQSLQVSA